MKGIITLQVFFLIIPAIYSQQISGVEETSVILKQIQQAGFTLHSSGMGINYRRGKQVNVKKSLLWEIGLLSMRDAKEVKSINPLSESSFGFKYGQLNAMFMLRSGIGLQKTLYAKGDIGGVEISMGYYGGISWGMLKPVYLNIIDFSDDSGTKQTEERYDPTRHFPDNIAGRASFFRGLGETKVRPGLYGSVLFNFDFGKNPASLRMVETGLAVDAFPNRMVIMADQRPARQIFFTFFIRLLIGQRWNRK